MDITEYQAKYFAHELTRRRPANDIGKFTASLQDAQVDLIHIRLKQLCLLLNHLFLKEQS
jgi:hypothetical protein